jgi:hypothetical protein
VADPTEVVRRFRLSRRYLRQLDKEDPPRARRIIAALKKVQQASATGGAHLEPVEGTPGLYTARMNKGWRFLLRREPDSDGPVYVVQGYGPHDVYKRRK